MNDDEVPAAPATSATAAEGPGQPAHQETVRPESVRPESVNSGPVNSGPVNSGPVQQEPVPDDLTRQDATQESGADEQAAGSVAVAVAKPRGSFLRELPFLVVVAFALALLIKAFLVQAFYIPSGSMMQTLEIRDRVLVNKLVYDFRDIRRGEVIVFNGKDSFSPDEDQLVFTEPSNPVQRVLRDVGGAVGLGTTNEKDFIKRVIGLPGDRVACCTNGHVTVQPPDGEPVELDEPYTYENDSPMVFCEAGTEESACPAGAPGVLVPAGRLFVMGDHRCCSSDSRLHLDDGQMGSVPEDEVIGRAFVVVWPVSRAAFLSVPSVFDQRALSLPAGAAAAVPYALGTVGAVPFVLLRRRRRSSRARST